MARKEFLDYIFKYAIEPQLGYSFSINHTLPYSVIAVQEANLATRWDLLYWQCACLCVNAGNYVGSIGEEDEEKSESATADYGKIAKALSAAQQSGVVIELPDINKSQTDFTPDVEHNAILYSLQAISVMNDDLLAKVFAGRPFNSVEDFYTRVEPTTVQMLGLIKAGCFDNLYKVSRKEIMEIFLQFLADQNIPMKEKLTTVQLKKAIELKMPELENFAIPVREFRYRVYLEKKCLDKEYRRYIITEEKCTKFFNTFIRDRLNLTKGEYGTTPDGYTIKAAALKRVIDHDLEPLMNYLNSEDGLKAFRKILQEEFKTELRDKYCYGSISRWEMETLSYYYHDHELKGINTTLYNIKDFDSLPEDGQQDICALAGTVINVDNNKKAISLLTNYGKAVDVKFFGTTYTTFNQKISVVDENTKKKTVIDDTWFKRGNKLIVYGQRKENGFSCRSMRTERGYSRSVGLIENANFDGSLEIRYTRNKK